MKQLSVDLRKSFGRQSSLFWHSSFLIRQKVKVIGHEMLFTKTEPSADVTNVGENSLMIDQVEEDGEGECQDGCQEDSRREVIRQTNSLSGRLEVLSLCDDGNSAESMMLRRALGRTQHKLISALYDTSEPLTRHRLTEILSRQREALLSTRDVINARADCLVLNDIPANKKITKKAKLGRRSATVVSSRTAMGTGLAMMLNNPIEVESEGDLYFANDCFSEGFEIEEREMGGMGSGMEGFGDGRGNGWAEKTEEELYGMGRLETDFYDRNIYFSSPESQNYLCEFD